MSKRWSKTEIAHLKKNADSQTLEELAQRFHVDAETVRAKMEELGLSAGGSVDESQDASLADFEKGLELVYASKWSEGKDVMDKVVANAETRELRDRARQFSTMCADRLAGEVDIEDPYLAAVVKKNRGDLTAARSIVDAAKDDGEKFAYLRASLAALEGDQDAAIEHLGSAIKQDPRNRVQAFHDPDFRDIRGTPEFRQLLDRPQA